MLHLARQREQPGTDAREIGYMFFRRRASSPRRGSEFLLFQGLRALASREAANAAVGGGRRQRANRRYRDLRQTGYKWTRVVSALYPIDSVRAIKRRGSSTCATAKQARSGPRQSPWTA